MSTNFRIATSALSATQNFQAGTWLVLLHVQRVPPHVGLLIGGNYNSLTVKGAELDVNGEVLMKTIRQKKIAAALIHITGHPVFSTAYQLEVLQHQVQMCGRVGDDTNTCLTPVKDFFAEFYGLSFLREELLHGFLDRLNTNGFIEGVATFHVTGEPGTLELPQYTRDELQQRIREERLPFYAG